jgi:2-polyprenyl-6-methoxyphenol hydroxylase-like FAD-dependent oxidoreductase
MAGEEYARDYSWGHGARKGEYDAVSSCHAMDLPQSLLEPVLVKYATSHGFKVRFDVELLSFTENEKSGKVDCFLKDRVTGLEWIVRTRFLFGADGGRSRVAKSLGLPFTSIPSGGTAWNILVKADLSHIMRYREGNLHWVMRLKRDYEYMAVCRMVKPWTEWMFVMFPKGPGISPERKSREVWKAIVEDMIDDESVGVEVVRMDKWTINETSADVISKGNV